MVIVAALLLLAAVGATIGWTRAGGGDDRTGQEIAVDYSQSGKQIEAAPGDAIKVTLESNVTTGFQWLLAENTNEAAVTPVNHVYVEPDESGRPLVGAGGHEEWTFRAAAEGASKLTLEYSQPWEGGAKAEKTFDLTVVVR